jgi:hypothetical protein
VQWIWNTNFYMDNANESHIGALRADGTEKPEADVSYRFGRFMEEIRDLFRERELEEVAVVFPYSNDFSNRKLAFDATTKLTRVLAYELNVPFRGVSEYHLEALSDDPARLIILPSAHNVDDHAFERLLEIVDRTEATLLITGPAGIDAYWRRTERLADVLGSRVLSNVLREESLNVAGRTVPVSFGNRRITQIFKEAPVGKAEGGKGAAGDSVVDVPYGKGRLIWSPLPVELNDRIEPISSLYEYALNAAGYQASLEWIEGGGLPGVYGRKLGFRDGALFAFVSEFASDAPVEVKDRKTGVAYSFVLRKDRSVLFTVESDGRLLSVYRPNEVEIRVTKA